MRERSKGGSRTPRLQSPFAAMLYEAHPLQLSITSNALGMVQNPESAKRKSRTLSLTSLPHASSGVGSRTLDKCAPSFPYSPTADPRDAHTPVRQPAHRDPVQSHSRRPYAMDGLATSSQSPFCSVGENFAGSAREFRTSEKRQSDRQPVARCA